MHHCLLIPELALYIVHFLADDRLGWHATRYLKNSADVARLARTCKALAEPCLDVLWRTQHSLVPLIMCLPSDVWELTNRGKTIVSSLVLAHLDFALMAFTPSSRRVRVNQSLKREPTCQDWSAVNKYARRVQFICQPASFALPRPDEAALASLLTPSNFGTLFPCLRTLDYSVISVTASMIQLLTSVLSTERHLESLASLSVICPRASKVEDVYNLFQAIRTKATRLESLKIESFKIPSSNSSLEVRLLEGEFRYLRKLELSWSVHVSPECLACLVRMQSLQEMSLSVRRDIELDFLSNGCPAETTSNAYIRRSGEKTFPTLKSLKVSANSLEQCTALLSLVTSPLLESINFSYDVQAPSGLIEAFFRQVERTCRDTASVTTPSSPRHTVSLTLKHNLGPFSRASIPFLIHPSQTLSPLLALPHLDTLRLLHLGTMAIDDGFLREAAGAWGAHLREFEECGIPWVGIEESGDLPGFVVATLDGIGAFVGKCKRLERLRMAFDGRSAPRAEERPDERTESEADQEQEQPEEQGWERERAQKSEEQMQGQAQPEWEGAQDRDQEDVDSGQLNERSAASTKSSALQVLNVRDSPIDNPERVAKFLKRVAPVLRVICVEGSLDMWRKWRDVENRMKLAGTC